MSNWKMVGALAALVVGSLIVVPIVVVLYLRWAEWLVENI
jgi:hypothetical protein